MFDPSGAEVEADVPADASGLGRAWSTVGVRGEGAAVVVGRIDEERPPRVTLVLHAATRSRGEVRTRRAHRWASQRLGLEVPAEHRPPDLATVARSRAFPR